MLRKLLPIFGENNGGNGRTQNLHPVPLQHARTVQLNATVERRLTAEGKQDAIGPLFSDDLLYKKSRHRQKVDLVCQQLGGLNGSNIGIDQDGRDALLAQRLESLRAGIVELARLPYLQRPCPQY